MIFMEAALHLALSIPCGRAVSHRVEIPHNVDNHQDYPTHTEGEAKYAGHNTAPAQAQKLLLLRQAPPSPNQQEPSQQEGNPGANVKKYVHALDAEER